MHDEHQQLRPWGTITPDFWDNGQGPDADAVTHESVRPAAAGLPEQAAAAEEVRRPAPSLAKPVTAEGAAAEAAPRAEGVVTATEQRLAAASSPLAEEGPPAPYLDRINSVVAVFGRPDEREDLAAAAVEAEKLDQEFTAEYGQHHSHTIRIREIRGWLALLMEQPAVAARWYLHTTGLQIALRGATHADTEGSVRRALHTWRQVKDPAEVVRIGGDLAKVVAAVLGEGGDAARFVQTRIARHEQPPQ
ncbi:hypothetical protein [Streptomyces sp. NPDC058548]|uniref:hypothetical protein n=1 Tax=Streptomyces sp. NPDC058548 TaxID=3346545 RepID=UPI00365DD0B0